MHEEHEEHLLGIKKDFTYKVDQKYRKGQLEHGGNLWTKAGLIDMALDEAIDQYVYLFTLRQQQIKDGTYRPIDPNEESQKNP